MTLSHLPLPGLVWYSRASKGTSVAWETLSRRWAEHMAKLPSSGANLFVISLGAMSSHEVHQVRSSHCLPTTRRYLTNPVSGGFFFFFNWMRSKNSIMWKKNAITWFEITENNSNGESGHDIIVGFSLLHSMSLPSCGLHLLCLQCVIAVS